MGLTTTEILSGITNMSLLECCVGHRSQPDVPHANAKPPLLADRSDFRPCSALAPGSVLRASPAEAEINNGVARIVLYSAGFRGFG